MNIMAGVCCSSAGVCECMVHALGEGIGGVCVVCDGALYPLPRSCVMALTCSLTPFPHVYCNDVMLNCTAPLNCTVALHH